MMVRMNHAPKWTSFDVIKGLFRYLPDNASISSSRPALHSAIFHLAQTAPFSSFLKDYRFEITGYFPFSRDLNIDMLNLEQSGHLSADHPDFADYKKEPKLNKSFDRYTKPLFNEEEISLIQKMSGQFKEESIRQSS